MSLHLSSYVIIWYILPDHFSLGDEQPLKPRGITKYNGEDLYDQSTRAYSSEHPTVDIHLMEYAVSWHGSHRKHAVQCFFCWSMEFCENIWTKFHLWGPRSYSSIQDNTSASTSCFQCKESLRKHKIHLQCSVKINSMQSKFQNRNNQGTKLIGNAMWETARIAWPWGKITSTGGLRGSIITYMEKI